MPRKNNNARVSSRSRTSSTTAPAATTTTTRTIAEDKLWGALRANPGATTAELSISAGIGRSTAGKLLAAWAADGSIERTAGTQAGRRAADRWTIPTTDAPSDGIDDQTGGNGGAPSAATPGPSAAPTKGSSTGDEAAAPEGADSAATTKVPRLSKGALRGLVEDYLRAHPGEAFSPNAIGKALDRSSGAVNNALEKLVTDGYAVRTQDKPKRFAIKPEK
jgi:hypothetical protein